MKSSEYRNCMLQSQNTLINGHQGRCTSHHILAKHRSITFTAGQQWTSVTNALMASTH